MFTDVFQARPLSSTIVEAKVREGEILSIEDRALAFSENVQKMELVPESMIDKSLISLFSWEEMKRIAVVNVTKLEETGKNTVWDSDMGVATPIEVCTYCQQYDCPGHYGLINFRQYKVYNPAYIRDIISVLRCVCRTCSSLLIPEDLMNVKGLLNLPKSELENLKTKHDVDIKLLNQEDKSIMDFKYERRLKAMEEFIVGKNILLCQKCNNTDVGINYEYLVKNVALEGEIRQTTMNKKDRKRDLITNKLEIDPGKVVPLEEIYKILKNISNKDANLLGFTETPNDIIIRISRDILYKIVANIKFFNMNFVQHMKKLLNENILILQEWNILMDNIKIILDKLTQKITTDANILVQDIIMDEIKIYEGEILNEIIQIKDVPKRIKRLVANIYGKIFDIIMDISIDIIYQFDNNNIENVIVDFFNNFRPKIINGIQRENIGRNANDIINYITRQLYYKATYYTDEIKILVGREVRANSTKIDSLLFNSHPVDLIMRGLLVIPRIARVRIYRNGNFMHTSITHFYMSILKQLSLLSEIDNELRTGVRTERIIKRRTRPKYGRPPLTAEQDYEQAVKNLYVKVRNLIFEKRKTRAQLNSKKPEPLSIYQLIQGKNALIRHGMMGKIVQFCARTVAGPDPSLRFGQIRIPKKWAPILTKPITVTDFNKKYLTGLLSNSDYSKRRITHITPIKTGVIERLTNKRYNLQIGDIISRWLENGDRITVNRQPTLQKQSMMKYEVVLGDELTIGLHLSYTTPMNADFDGDEVNAWSPQDFEVEAEVEIIMNVKNNIMSIGQNRPSMGLVMNSVTASYLISKMGYIVSANIFNQLYDLITPKPSLQSLSARLRKYGVHPYSGDAVLSALLPKDFYYNQKGVLIIHGVLISGRLKKSSVGASSRSIIQDLYKRYGKYVTADFFTDASWVLNKWIMERGFSVGLNDMMNLYLDKTNQKEIDKNIEVLKVQLANVYNQLETLATKLDDPIEEAFRQKQIVNLSNVTTGIGIKLADDALTPDNSIAVMTEKGAGTKGAVANIGQMMGAVGQQFIYGERIPTSITNGTRTLPIFDENESNPEAHGFIPTSFLTGLDPAALFFLQAGGRPNLLDTALKTQDTGSLQHKMVKAFENVEIGFDGSVRNTIGHIFLPMYNSGYDTGEMLFVNDERNPEFSSFIDIKSLADELNLEAGWIPKHVKNHIVKNKEKYDDIVNDKLPIGNGDDAIDDIDYTLLDPHKRELNYYELSRIIGARAKQLENNAKPLVKIGNTIDFVDIAMMEYDAGLLDNINIIEKYSNGTSRRIVV
jgi:DNA-directed RNA polymerase beta' subunit/DNA-directed RNA polymerase subunit K/omega